jgi:DNA mismatch repair protein MutS
MSGKSTYMRQIALICLLAQAGSFVPADAAELPILDRIFTRVGASDDIAGGQSTFMREMSELTDILHDATEDSLVLLDEVGRGTSTADGLAIARATTEFIHDEVGAATLFATHYHDLTDLAADLPNAFNRHFTVRKQGADDPDSRPGAGDTDVTFLHRVADGPASSSYGVEVAKLAGVPDRVVERASEYVRESGERPESDPGGGGRDSPPDPESDAPGTAAPDAQSARAADGTDDGDAPPARGDTLAAYVEGLENGTPHDGDDATPAEREALAALRDVEIARTTPLEALNTLEELQRQLDE